MSGKRVEGGHAADLSAHIEELAPWKADMPDSDGTDVPKTYYAM